MIQFYLLRIQAGRMTIDEVPIKWRADVEKALTQ